MEPQIITFTKRTINPMRLKVSDICIEDIAHGLAIASRWANQARMPVPTAQHCVYVSKLCPTNPLGGLLHDAFEAFLPDVPRWIKETEALRGYCELEERNLPVILEALGCTQYNRIEIDAADRLMARMEGYVMFGEAWRQEQQGWAAPMLTQEELKRIGPWAPWDWHTAERAFLKRYHELRAAVAVA